MKNSEKKYSKPSIEMIDAQWSRGIAGSDPRPPLPTNFTGLTVKAGEVTTVDLYSNGDTYQKY